MFIPAIRIYPQSNSKTTFKGKNPIAAAKDVAYISPQLKLANLFENQKEGKLSALKKIFKSDEIEGFYTLGYIKRIGKNWEKTETGDKYISQFYKASTEEEAEFSRYLASIGY